MERMAAKIPADTLRSWGPHRYCRPTGSTAVGAHSNVEHSSPLRHRFGWSAGSSSRCLAALAAGRFVAVAECREEAAERDVEGVAEGMPCGQGTGSTTLLDFDEGAPGQASPAGQFVVAPAALGPQARELHA